MKEFIEDTDDLYQNAPCGYITIRKDGHILNANQTLLTWLDFRIEELVGEKSIQDLLSIGDKIYFETHYMPLLQLQEEVSEITVELNGNCGKRLPVLINAKKVALKTDDEPVYRISALDMSLRKKYEKELITARKEAEETAQLLRQSNENLENFTIAVSHDLKAPVSNIFSIIYLLEDQNLVEPDSQAEEFITEIKKNTSRMNRVIQDLLEFSKINNESDSDNFESVDLNEVCREALDALKNEIQQNGATFQISELPTVLGSKTQFESLFQNLFFNALKYRSEAPPEIEVSREQTGAFCTINVKDNGVGINPSDQDDIFEFMKRSNTKTSVEGTGIGLTVCRQIVENHGGRIGVNSEPGKGSTFYFTLPVFDGDDSVE